MRRSMGLALAGLAVLVSFAAARQEAKPIEPAQPEPIQPGPAHRPEPAPINPTGMPPEPRVPSGTLPGLEARDLLVGASGLRAEGTFLVERRGSMIRLGRGERVFVFHATDKGKRERPMVLLACQLLQQMEQMAEGAPTVFVVTGQVFVYGGVNYLLPTLARQGGQAAPEETASPVKPTESAPGVQELIRQLEAQREQPRGPEARPAEAQPGPGTSAMVAEGQSVARRRGRLVRAPEGAWALAFDSGAAGDTKVDRPMILSPCLNLQRMEAWAMRGGDATSFEVSGRVLAYQGRNYLIPTMFQVCPVSELEAKH